MILSGSEKPPFSAFCSYRCPLPHQSVTQRIDGAQRFSQGVLPRRGDGEVELALSPAFCRRLTLAGLDEASVLQPIDTGVKRFRSSIHARRET
jgi:hypothetical protein